MILNKILILLFGVLLSCILFACDLNNVEHTNDSEVNATFIGIIEEINDYNALVKVEEGAISVGSNVFVNLSVNNTGTFQIGDKINVGFDGTIRESEPLQINTIFVKLVE